MNKLEVNGDGNIAKAKLKKKWAKITYADVQFVLSKRDELLGCALKYTGARSKMPGKVSKGSRLSHG